MSLADWLASQPYGAISRLSRASGVSMLTIRRVRDGHVLTNTKVAKQISDATGRKVSVSTLCDLKALKRAG